MARNWKKTVGWVAAALLLLIFAIGVTGYFVVRSQSFRNYVLTTAARKASEATGGQVSAGNYAVRFRPLTIKLDHFVVRGSEPERDLPLFQADQITLGLKIVSLISHKIDLTEVEVAHPIVNLLIDQNGRSNIPQPKTPTKNNQPVDVFNLGIQRILLADGEIYYNSQPTPLNAELHDLQTEVKFDSARAAFTGSISYDRGRLQFGTFKALPHTLRARFDATRSGLRIDPVELSLASSHVTAHANITDYRQPLIEGTYRIVLHTQDFRRVLQNPSLPVGDITLDGSLRYQDVPGRTPLQAASLQGNLTSSGLELSTVTATSRISNLRAAYVLEDGNFRARDVAAEVLGGRLAADLTVRGVATTRASNLRATLREISLQGAARALRAASVRQVPLTGRTTADVKASWHGSLQGLVATADGSLAAALDRAATDRGAPSSIPINGQFHVIYNGDQNLTSVAQTQLRTPDSLLSMAGTISNRSNLQVQLSTQNLHELELLSSSFASTPATQPAKQLNVYGTAVVNARVQGSLKQPSLTGQLVARDLRVQHSNWRSLQVQFAANPARISLQRGTLLSTGPGTVQFNFVAGLHDWKFAPTNPMQAEVTADRLSAAQLISLAGLQYPVTGNLSSHISVHGSQLNPIGNGNLQLTQAQIAGTPVQKVSLSFQGSGDAVHSTATLNMAAGSITGNLIFYPKTAGYEVQLAAPHIRLDQIPRLRDMQISGTLAASGKGRGTLQQPEGELVASLPELQIRQKTISGITARVNVANQRANVFLNSTVGSAFIRATGDIDLTGNKVANLRLDTNGIPLAALAAAFMNRPNQQLEGELELHASASGPLNQPYEMQAHAEIPNLKVAYRNFQIGNPLPIHLNYRNGAVALERTQLSGTGTTLDVQGIIPVRTTAPASFAANGKVDLGILQLFNPDITSSGRLELAINAMGSKFSPSIESLGVQGQIKIVNATLATTAAPIGIEGLNGTLLVENNRLEIKEFAGDAGGGKISATGFIGYRPSLAFNVALNAEHVRLLYPDGVRTVFNSNLLLEGTPDASNLSGRVLLDSLSFTPSFDLASFMSQSGEGSSGTPSGGPAQNLHLDVALQSAGDLQVVSSQLSLEGQVNLRVLGTAAAPVIVGRTDLTGGEVFFMNKRYQIERATAEFNNPNRTEPDLNVLVTTVVRQYNISLNLVGPLDRLRTNYISDPPLPPVDIINLLARGKTTEEPSTGNLGANALLAQGLASQVGGQVQKLAGISSLQIDPLIGGDNRNPSARLAIQQRVTKDFFFTFSTDVTSTQDQVVQGEYQISNRWSVSALRNENGNIGVDAKFHKTF